MDIPPYHTWIGTGWWERKMEAPETGFEPVTIALTGRRSAVELLGNIKQELHYNGLKAYFFQVFTPYLESSFTLSPNSL